MNLSQVKKQNNAALKRYTNFGTKLFLETLRSQAVANPNDFDMSRAYTEFYEKVYPDAGQRGYYQIRGLEKTKDFTISDLFLQTWRAWIGKWVQENLAQQIRNVNDNTRKIIRDTLQNATELGLNPFQTEKLLYDTVGSKARARAIAITEGTRANNMGQKTSGEDFATVTGLKVYKLWIHSGNPREPRLSHIVAQNKPIPKDAFFSVEGIEFDTPGNPVPGQPNKAVARQVINCGCSVSYVSERFARKRFPDSF